MILVLLKNGLVTRLYLAMAHHDLSILNCAIANKFFIFYIDTRSPLLRLCGVRLFQISVFVLLGRTQLIDIFAQHFLKLLLTIREVAVSTVG